MLLTTYTAVKIKEQTSWIHHTRIKRASRPQWESAPTGPLKLQIQQKRWTMLGLFSLWLGPTLSWETNYHFKLTPMWVNLTRAKDCWVCMAMPRGNLEILLYRVMTSNWTFINNATGVNMWKAGKTSVTM